MTNCRPSECKKEYNVELNELERVPKCDCVIYAVPHKKFLEMDQAELFSNLKDGGVLIDIKSELEINSILNMNFKIVRI